MADLAFTICARNYIGLARVLQDSLRAHAPSLDFRIYVVDGLPDDAASDAILYDAPRALEKIICPAEFANMALMYDVTEFCTALKAACFMHGLADDYSKCIYFDPDIFIMGALDPIFEGLEVKQVLVTPHLSLPSIEEGPRADRGLLATGVYNLGFLGVSRGPVCDVFLNWWHSRLRKQAFNDHYSALFTDQRWMDFLTCLFDEESVGVLRHLGCNAAPWNFHERRLVESGRRFMVEPRRQSFPVSVEGSVPLVFVHFSGFDFRAIVEGRFDQRNLLNAESFGDLKPIYSRYQAGIAARAETICDSLLAAYGFAKFADDSPVLPSHRRLFRVWRERNGYAAAPFAIGPRTFHDALRRRRLLARRTADNAASDQGADKASLRTVGNPGRLIAFAHTAFRLAFAILGRARFFLLVRSLTRLGRFEEHYDTLRLDRIPVTGLITTDGNDQ